MKRTAIAVLLLFSLITAQSSEGLWRKPTLRSFSSEWYIPDWAKVQYGGYLGFISVGAGYQSLFEYANFDLMYGFTPKGLPGVYSTIHTVAVKVTIPFKTVPISHDYEWGMSLGFNTTLSFGENILRFNQPDYYPDDYYGPQFFHVIPFIGTRFIRNLPELHSRVRAVELYAELCMHDDYLWYAITNESVSVGSAMGGSLGIVWHFRKAPNLKYQ